MTKEINLSKLRRLYKQLVPKHTFINDQAAIINGYSVTGYKELIDDMIISTGIFTRAVNSISDDDVRISSRLFAPKSRLRGFESGKVGPKDGRLYWWKLCCNLQCIFNGPMYYKQWKT